MTNNFFSKLQLRTGHIEAADLINEAKLENALLLKPAVMNRVISYAFSKLDTEWRSGLSALTDAIGNTREVIDTPTFRWRVESELNRATPIISSSYQGTYPGLNGTHITLQV